MIRILGIDPGLAHTGYGVIEIRGSRCHHLDHGVIETSPDWTTGARLSTLYVELSRIVARYEPGLAGIENLYFMRNIRSALPVAQARGIALLVLEQAGVEVSEFTPQQIKQTIVGTGGAVKHQVQELVRILLGLEKTPEPDHAADALAAAICVFHMNPPAIMKYLKAER